MSIDLQELMRHHDDITAAFHTLLLPCPFCGRTIAEKDTRSSMGSGPHISCDCGAWMSGGILELLAAWNRRDGKEFTLESEYTQRLLESESRYASLKKEAFQIIKERDAALAKMQALAAHVNTEAASC